jgi:hypothetical protein
MVSFNYGTTVLLALSLVGCVVSTAVIDDEVSTDSEAIEGGQSVFQGGIGGSTPDPYPAVAYTDNGPCSAALIAPSLVLSSAQCRPAHDLPQDMKVGLGRNYTSLTDYVVDATATKRDLMLMHLSTPVTGVSPLIVNSGAFPAVNTSCTAVGFGSNQGAFPYVKRYASVKVSKVEPSWPRLRTDWVDGLGSYGDEGGPLLCNGTIAGVLSWPLTNGVNPQQGHNTYTAVDADWIAATGAALAPPTVQNSLYMVQRKSFYRVDDAIGSFQKVSGPSDDWWATGSFTALGNTFYALRAGYLSVINPQTGAVSKISSRWWSEALLTALNGVLYVAAADGLYAIDNLATGEPRRISDTIWSPASSFIARTGLLYIIQDDMLFEVDPLTGSYWHLGPPAWSGWTSMATIGSDLYILQDIGIWKIVNFTTGEYTRIGNVNWTGAESMTAMNGVLFVVQDSRLYAVDPVSGAYTGLGGADWPSPARIEAMP